MRIARDICSRIQSGLRVGLIHARTPLVILSPTLIRMAWPVSTSISLSAKSKRTPQAQLHTWPLSVALLPLAQCPRRQVSCVALVFLAAD
jgi:hypothetical protein